MPNKTQEPQDFIIEQLHRYLNIQEIGYAFGARLEVLETPVADGRDADVVRAEKQTTQQAIVKAAVERLKASEAYASDSDPDFTRNVNAMAELAENKKTSAKVMDYIEYMRKVDVQAAARMLENPLVTQLNPPNDPHYDENKHESLLLSSELFKRTIPVYWNKSDNGTVRALLDHYEKQTIRSNAQATFQIYETLNQFAPELVGVDGQQLLNRPRTSDMVLDPLADADFDPTAAMTVEQKKLHRARQSIEGALQQDPRGLTKDEYRALLGVQALSVNSDEAFVKKLTLQADAIVEVVKVLKKEGDQLSEAQGQLAEITSGLKGEAAKPVAVPKGRRH